VGGADVKRILKALLVQYRVENRLEGRLALRAGHERHHHRCRRSSRVRSAAAFVLHHVLNEAARKEPPTKVVFNLEKHGSFVKLTLTHENFAEGSKLLDGISRGWPAILSSLKSLLESGTALAIPISALGIEAME
jgi:Activator of Hsp90 ATPase homolog 1-like protein